MSLDVYNIDKKGFAERHKEKRLKHGLKQKEIAEYLNITRAYISTIESPNVEATPGLNYIIAIRSFFKDKHNDRETYDWWIEGTKNEVTENKTTKELLAEVERLLNKIEDLKEIISSKDEIIYLLKEKLK